MHDALRHLRGIESLPDEQVYQVLYFIEFLESKYARYLQVQVTGLHKFAEGIEDKMLKTTVSPSTISEAFQILAAADRVLLDVSTAGKQVLGALGATTPEEGAYDTSARKPE